MFLEELLMKNRHSMLVVLFLALGMGWAQDSTDRRPPMPKPGPNRRPRLDRFPPRHS